MILLNLVPFLEDTFSTWIEESIGEKSYVVIVCKTDFPGDF